MKFDHRQFDIDESLHDIDIILQTDNWQYPPKRQFSMDLSKGVGECAYAGVIVVNLRILQYDNSLVLDFLKAYEIAKKMLFDIFRDNTDCIDIFCVSHMFCGIFNTPVKSQVDSMLETMGKLNAAILMIDMKLKKLNINVRGNCGCDYGVMYHFCNFEVSNQTGDDWSWYGRPLDKAILYSESEIKNDKNGTIISENVKSNIKEEYANLFSEDKINIAYYSTLVDTAIYDKWSDLNKQL